MTLFRGADLIRDVGGDIGTFSLYIESNSHRSKIAKIIDCYLANVEIQQVVCGPDGFDVDLLKGHKGEVWITGPCMKRVYKP